MTPHCLPSETRLDRERLGEKGSNLRSPNQSDFRLEIPSRRAMLAGMSDRSPNCDGINSTLRIECLSAMLTDMRWNECDYELACDVGKSTNSRRKSKCCQGWLHALETELANISVADWKAAWRIG